MVSFHSLEEKIERLCHEMAANSESWLSLRQQFYQKYGPPVSKKIDFGQFEIGFLTSQNQRGVFNPIDANPPGSLWWQNLNTKLLYDSQLAAALYESNLTPEDVSPEVDKWLKFIKKPTVKRWYRAFNASVITAANLYRADAAQEDEAELLYINTVLYRLMWAQAMVEEAQIFGETGSKVGKGIKFSADLISFDAAIESWAIPAKEPEGLAISAAPEIVEGLVEQLEERLGSVDAAFLGSAGTREAQQEEAGELAVDLAKKAETLDSEVILPHLATLYDRIAKWNDVPFVEDWCQNGRPVYPAI